MNASCNSTLNRSCQTEFHLVPWYAKPYNMTMVVLYTLIIIAAIIGNILVCTAVFINPSLRKNMATYFIVSLAVSDICTACFSMSFDLQSFITSGRWIFSEALCDFWTTAYLMTVPTSMWNLLALSVTRYNMLKNPWDRYRDSPLLTPKRSIITILFIWLYCLALALVPIMGVKRLTHSVVDSYCHFNVSPIYSNAIAFLNFYLPIFAMGFIYYKIYKIARTQYVMGLKTNPSPSVPEMPSGMNMDVELNAVEPKQENDSKRDHISIITDVNADGSGFYNRGLDLDNRDKESGMIAEGHIEDTSMKYTSNADHNRSHSECKAMKTKTSNCCSQDIDHTEAREGEMEENMNENMNNCEKQVNGKQTTKDDTLTTTAILYSDSSDQITKTLCEVEINHESCLTRKTLSQPGTSTEMSLDHMSDDVIQDTTRDTTDELSHKSSRQAGAIVISSTSKESSKHIQNQIAFCSLDDRTSDVSPDDVAAENTNPPGSEGKSGLCKIPQNTDNIQSLQESQDSVCTTTQDNLSASRNALDTDLTKRRKIFVKNKKATRTIAIIVGAFLFCWMPVTTLSVIMNICKDECYRLIIFHTSQVLLLLGYLNSAINPIIFSCHDEEFLKSYRKIMKKLFPCQ